MQTTNSKPFAPVALVQAQQYDPALIDRAVERLLELLNIPSEWFCGKRVLIKPNLLCAASRMKPPLPTLC